MMTSLNKPYCFACTVFISLLAMLLPMIVSVQVWNESFDSGNSIALADITTGSGPLTSINAAHIAQFDAVEMFCLSIPD